MSKIFKRFAVIFICILTFFLFNENVFAKTKLKVTYSGVNLRSGAGTNYDSLLNGGLPINATYDLVSGDKFTGTGCDDGWYQIYYSGNSTGYVCSSYTELVEVAEMTEEAKNACEKDLQDKGFPKSYWNGLCNLKNKYPNWNFVADKNGLDFATAVSKESVGKMALIQTNNVNYLSKSEDSYDYLTNTYIVKEGSNWYSAHPDVVAYYLDPRNFFDESSVFMFEKLSFDKSYQTKSAIKKVLKGTDIKEKSTVIYDACKKYNVNAIYLSSRIKQETTGNYSNYSLAGNQINGVSIYNPYNIGAYTGAYDGLVWAANGTSYYRPWTSLDTAIKGGAQYISKSYISIGQDTGYFQKFNTSSYCQLSKYSHQYMTNVQAAYSEALSSYRGYNEMGLLTKTNFVFVIPVYENMNEGNYQLPSDKSNNNHLKVIKINDSKIAGFSHDVFNYTYYVAENLNKITVKATALDSTAKIKGTGDITLTNKETEVTIKVTAQNGSVQKYKIKVIKTSGVDMSVKDIMANSKLNVKDKYLLFATGYSVEKVSSKVKSASNTVEVDVKNKTSGNLATGDAVTIKNGNNLAEYNIVIKGDPSGDGGINILDLLKVQKQILGYTKLSGSYFQAGDVNQDGKIDILDLLKIQKHILGYSKIK